MVQQTDVDWISALIAVFNDGGEARASELRTAMQNLRDSIAFAPIQGVDDGQLAVVRVDGAGLMTVHPAPARLMPDGNIFLEGTPRTESTSIEIGPGAKISSLNSFLAVTNDQIPDTQFVFIDARQGRDRASERPRQFVLLGGEAPIVVESSTAGTLTANPLIFDYRVTTDSQTNAVQVLVSIAMTNVRAKVSYGEGAQSDIRFLPNEQAWITGTGGLNWSTGTQTLDFGLSGMRTFAINIPPGTQPDLIRVELRADNVSLVGDTVSGIPNLTVINQSGEFKDLAYLSDIENLRSEAVVTELTSDLTITSSNAATYFGAGHHAIFHASNVQGTVHDLTVEPDALPDNAIMQVKHYDVGGVDGSRVRVVGTADERWEHPLRNALEMDVIIAMDDGVTWRRFDGDWYIDSSFIHNDTEFSEDDRTKLDGIEPGAEVNVQSDWDVSDTTSDAYIQNKPAIPTARTDEDIRDVMAATLVAGNNITITEDDAGDTITVAASGSVSNTDEDAIHDNVAAEISAIATEKTSPHDDDWLLLEDSESSNEKRKVKVGNLPAVDVTNLPEITINSNIDLNVEANYNTYVNHRIIVTQNENRTVTLPEINPSRVAFASHGDLFAFEHRTELNPTQGGVRLVLEGGAGNEGFSDGVRNGNIRQLNAAGVYDPDASPSVAGDYVLIQVPAEGFGVWNVLSTDADASETAMAAASHWEFNDEDEDAIESDYPIKGLKRTSTIYFSNSGDDEYWGRSIDRPVSTFTRVWDIVDNDGFSYAAGAMIKVDDDSYVNEAVTLREHFDLHAPEASFRGLTVADGSQVIAKTILTSIGQIVMAPNAHVQLQRIENTGTGAQVQFPAGALGDIVLKIRSADFSTAPLTFASGTNSGNIHVEIDASNLTADPFNDVRSDYNITGYIALSNGQVIHYGGGQGHDVYVRSLDESVTADLNRPVMLFRNETAGRTLTLPAASTSPKERSVYRHLIANHSFAATSHDLNVVIASSGEFQNGENDFVLPPGGEAIVELWNVPEGSFWRYNIIETRYQARFNASVGGADEPPLESTIDLTMSSNTRVPANLFSINVAGDIVVNAACRIKFENVGAIVRWHNASEFFHGADVFRAGSGTSGGQGSEAQNDVDQTFTFATAFTHGTDADIVVVTTPTQLNRTQVLPVVDTTLTGFTINRAGEIDGDVGFHYMAVNTHTLDNGGADGMFSGSFFIQKNATDEIGFMMNPQPRIQNQACGAFARTSGDGWIDCVDGDIISVRQAFTDGVSVMGFQMNVEVIVP